MLREGACGQAMNIHVDLRDGRGVLERGESPEQKRTCELESRGEEQIGFGRVHLY